MLSLSITISTVIEKYKKTGSPKCKTSPGSPRSLRALERSARAQPYEPYMFHLEHAGIVSIQ